jgi:hypothetical protein
VSPHQLEAQMLVETITMLTDNKAPKEYLARLLQRVVDEGVEHDSLARGGCDPTCLKCEAQMILDLLEAP